MAFVNNVKNVDKLLVNVLLLQMNKCENCSKNYHLNEMCVRKSAKITNKIHFIPTYQIGELVFYLKWYTIFEQLNSYRLKKCYRNSLIFVWSPFVQAKCVLFTLS